MAPGRIDFPTDDVQSVASSRPTVYLLDTFHPTALKHAQTKFNAVLPSDAKHARWHENAEYLLIRGSYLTKEDIDQCPNLKAVGKQGVGTCLLTTF
jgi:phosphoglycerate dehydrogenase-like enzyme